VDARLTSACLLFCLAAPLLAAPFGDSEFAPQSNGNGPRLDPPKVQYLEVGVVITAEAGACRNILATLPVPFDCPEQQVRVAKEDVSPLVAELTYRSIGPTGRASDAGTARQMVLRIPHLPAGEECRAVVTFEIHRSTMQPPQDTSVYQLCEPRKLPKDVRPYLKGSPKIEVQDPKIKALARRLREEHQDEPAWDRVKAIYDWVRANVTYKEGPLRGAAAALEAKQGDCEELTSLFIALCRANEIPARSVWVPGHCYPEFYLVDSEGVGYWFPCQAAGTEAFGGIPEERPILQKGDNFRTPEKPRETQRYLSEYLTGTPAPGAGQPKVKFIRQIVARPAEG
jgi:transglutaminase-like putative cysteine protease